MIVQTGFIRHGGQVPQFLEAYSIRFAHKEMVHGMGTRFIYVRSPHGRYMKNLSPKKTDWVRFAWILEECGDLSANQISYIFNNMWSNRSRSASSVAQIMVAHRSKGFETVQELTFGHEHIKIWTFYGQVPEINRRTTIRWRKSLNPLRGSV